MLRRLSFRRQSSSQTLGTKAFTYDLPKMFVYNSELSPPHFKTRALLLIDPQNDFIAEDGSLKVEGAIEDSNRVAQAIRDHMISIDHIFVTLDTHQRLHIAHPTFWKGADGLPPKPFTQITSSDIRSSKWVPTVEEFKVWSTQYVQELERQNKFNLTIWPEHCLVGTKGHAVYDSLSDAMHEWELKKHSAVSFLLKGNNALTEHYSAFKAEVIRPDDKRTALNLRFITALTDYEEIIVAGQALSHCVNYSVRDLVSTLTPENRKKIIVLTDGCSTIAGFEDASKSFRQEMEVMGVRFLSTNEAFQE